MAEQTLELLQLAKTEVSPDSLKNYFTKKIIPTKGFKCLIRHFSRFNKWDAEKFYDQLIQSIKKQTLEDLLYNEKGELNFYGRSKVLWLGAFNNIDSLRNIITYLKNLDLKTQTIIEAKKYLPENSTININFYFVLSGGSPAFSIGNENGIDVLQLPRLSNDEINIQRLLNNIAHESHHSGLFSYLSEYSPSLLEDSRFNLLGTIVAEGIPTYYINNLPKKLNEIYQTDDPLDKQVIADWNKHLSSIKELYRIAELDIAKSMEGKLTEQELFERWLSGAQGAAYILGTDMFDTIDRCFSVDITIEIIKDIRKLLFYYNEGAKKLTEENKFIFNTELVEMIMKTKYN
ncbi:MAG: hypothetical protein MUP85_17700 [Candidatus Lokiarchaeota archaeon]|nr:hypothetical protein [Candidatus Lokiarchaeota archaeon]